MSNIHCLPVNFVSTSYRLPPKSGTYLCVTTWGIKDLTYSKVHKLFNTHDNAPRERAECTAMNVIAWASLTMINKTYKDAREEIKQRELERF